MKIKIIRQLFKTTAEGSDLKVLIAEDDQFLANAYKLKLKKAGFEILVVSDGEEALEAMSSFKPDVVLLDLIMPNLDGFTFLSQVQKDDSMKNVPIIVASNLGQKEDIQKAKELGARDYVIKSDMSLEELIAKLERLVTKK